MSRQSRIRRSPGGHPIQHHNYQQEYPLHDTTNSTFDSSTLSLLNLQGNPSTSYDHQYTQRSFEARPKTLAERFGGIPGDRFEVIAGALSKAGTAYIEGSRDTNDSALFFENAIDRALMPLLDPASTSQSLRKSFSYEELKEANLADLIQNMKLIIAGQREEIECLRITVMELVLGIAGSHEADIAPPQLQKKPAVVQVGDLSPDDDENKEIIFRRLPKNSKYEEEEEEEDGISYLLSAIVRSRSNLTDDSHYIEPEGMYMPQQNTNVGAERKKKDPPTNNDITHRDESVSWMYDTQKNRYDSAEVGENDVVNINYNEYGGGDFVVAQSFHNMSSRSAIVSPARERAKNIVQERRRRYQNFRQKNGNGDRDGNSSQTKLTAMSRGSTISTGSREVSPLVRFREDELTLMETETTRDTKKDAQIETKKDDKLAKII
ncbi:hypothetical protein IV203_000787 [Nitzschia inconspicua]|uniref:Uncharacterized protein n=1 Tax=Nitzschia inconspicua TaxID=303405 RepID=A0A9K3L827_9STRA|nr:hypothetical protein IV203_000787 [Nitzschia inconspicua]